MARAHNPLAESFAINDRMNQVLLEYLDPRAWRESAAGNRTRNIAAIFAHVHNVRRKWLRLSAPHIKQPPVLDRARCTQEQAKTVLAASAVRCCEILADARVKTFLRDGWAKSWPAGVAMLSYMVAHEAHHRGQVCMLAHQLGYPLAPAATSHMWSWERLSKDCGFRLSQ